VKSRFENRCDGTTAVFVALFVSVFSDLLTDESRKPFGRFFPARCVGSSIHAAADKSGFRLSSRPRRRASKKTGETTS